jgi:hypothetical protein
VGPNNFTKDLGPPLMKKKRKEKKRKSKPIVIIIHNYKILRASLGPMNLPCAIS